MDSLSGILGLGTGAPPQQSPPSYGGYNVPPSQPQGGYGSQQSQPPAQSYGGQSSDSQGGKSAFSNMLKDDDPEFPVAPTLNVGILLDKAAPADILEKVSTLMASLVKSRFSVRYKVVGDAQVDFPIINGLNMLKPTFTRIEVILPWKDFAIESIPRSGHAVKTGYTAKRVTAALSGNWNAMKPAMKAFRASETHLMLGKSGESPLIVLLTWSKDGAESVSTSTDLTKYNKHMFRIAEMYNIPVINLLNVQDAIDRLERVLAKYPFVKE